MPSAEVQATQRPGRAYYVLALLVVVSALNFLDRTVISIVMEPIKRELHATDTEMGLLTGFAFALLYSTAALPIGFLADRFNRKNILAAALALWSGMTLLCGVANSFATLFIARAGVGLGEAGGIPTTNSLIADYFEPAKRGAANSWVGLGSSIGAALGLAVGGIVNHYWGWRWALAAAGAPGLIVALVVVMTVREPERGTFDHRTSPAAPLNIGHAIVTLFRNKRLMHLILGGGLGNIGNGVILWLPAFYGRSFDMGTAAIGLWLTPIQGVASALGVLIAGRVADRLYKRDPRWHPWLVAVTSVACVPFLLGALLAPSRALSFALLFPAIMLKFAYIGPYNASMQELAGPRLRAGASAIGMLAVSILGFGIAPVLIGALSDMFGHAGGGLRSALCLVTPIMLWSAYHSYLAGGRAPSPGTPSA